jgi:uncharacterized repeat protein (TIGR03847 family)
MSASFDLEAPDHFTVGAVGPPGQRVFYLQGRQAGSVVTLKAEKEQVRVLGAYLARLLDKVAPRRAGAAPGPGLLEPADPAWAIASLELGYDEARDQILIVATEFREEEEAEAATARFAITPAQAAGLVERTQALMKAGRPICPMCSAPMDPDGHVCSRANGHAAR